MTDPHPAQRRIEMQKTAARKASAQALVDFFAKHHPALLVKTRTECLEAVVARMPGATAEQQTAAAWRDLLNRLRFLKGEEDQR